MEINHRNYEKLTDDIDILGYNLILRLNVTLSKTDKNHNRHYYHKEFMYNSDKYLDTKSLITLRRSFDYYMTLENMTSVDGQKESIMIRIQDIMNFRMVFNAVSKWFSNSDIFGRDNKGWILKGTIDPLYITGLAGNKQIKIMPTIVKYESVSMPGIRLFLNGDANFTDINVNKVMGLNYILHTINLFESAQMLVNYLQRPPSGEEVVKFEDSGYINEGFGLTECKPNRKIPNQRSSKKTSYFDKIDDL